MISRKTGCIAVLFSFVLLLQPTLSASTTGIPASSYLSSYESDNVWIHQDSLQQHPLTLGNEPTPPQPAGTVAILVEHSLYSNVSTAVSQYRSDLNDTGYHTIVYTDELTTAEEMKTLFSDWYDSENLLGAVLIGRLPYAQYYHDGSVSGFAPETFICDLFLTDLDGTWGDVLPVDGIYDTHSASPGADIYPEIFLGRIDPTCLTWGSSVADHINTYLARVHDYRTGGVTRNKQALFYVDDDWSPWATSWSNDAASAYASRTLVHLPHTATNATDWLNRITQNYQWGHLCAHSSPTMHYFASSSPQDTTSSAQIHAAPPSFNFYNLYCCSGAKWTIGDNLGVTYTFSGDYSLASVGSSKTGSMMDNEYFYNPLGQNATIGESLRDWFSRSLTSSGEAGTSYLRWYYGMNIIGDPLLTIHYDCTVLSPSISSQTHPNPTSWYDNSRPQINWSTPADVNDIIGYYYILNQHPDTIPTKYSGTYTTTNGTSALEDLPNGTWYYHVVAVDSVGNVGQDATHFTVNIDTTSPETHLLYPKENGFSSSNSLLASWTFTDDYSTHAKSIVWIDTSANIIQNSSALTCFITGLSEGTHVINVTSYDEAMNRVSLESTFSIDLTDPLLSLIEPTQEIIVGNILTIDWDVSDALSGYQLAEVFLDNSSIGTVHAPNSSLVVNDVDYGEHTFNITVFDIANNTASVEFTVIIQQSIYESLSPAIIGMLIGIGGVSGVAIVIRRRR